MKTFYNIVVLQNTFEGDEEDDFEDTAVGRLLLALEVGDFGFAEGALAVVAVFVEALCDGSTIFLMSFFCFSASISSYLIGIEDDLNWFKQHLDEDMGRCFRLKIIVVGLDTASLRNTC